MFLKLLLHRLVQWKWMLIIPAVTAPSLALVMLLFAEPAYVSTCRLWVKERAESSQLLKIQRLGQQQNTYVEVQQEIIASNPVLEDVVHLKNLTDPPPKQSIWSNLTGFGRKSEPVSDLDATDDLRGRIWVTVANPEIIEVGCKMNSPELAQEVLRELVSAYRRQYLSILNVEVNEYKLFLKDRLESLLGAVGQLEKELETFDATHPDVATVPTLGGESLLSGSPEIGLVRDVGEISPVPMVLEELARLKLELIRSRVRFAETSDVVFQLNQQILDNQALLDEYMAELSENARWAVRHEALKWRLREARRQYTSINTEYHRILITEGTKLKQTSSITQLNRPTYEPEQISPRKKATLMVSGVLGLFFGFALFYLRLQMDHTYSLAAEAEIDLGIPVLAQLPLDPPPEPGRLDRIVLRLFRVLKKLIPRWRKKA